MWDEFCSNHKIDSRLAQILTEDLKFTKITKVQYEVIPRFSKNQDVIVKACTGSGKTLAYVLPLYQQLISHHESILASIKENYGKDYSTIKGSDEADHFYTTKKGVLGVVLLPTRELAIQVYNIILTFSKHKSLEGLFSAVLLIGGKGIQYDIDKFSNESLFPTIIVATPSRLYDLVEKLDLEFRNTQVVVLDEADKMLELGYLQKLSHLISRFNKQRRTGLFSATINSQLQNMVITGMRNPVFIDVKFESKNLDDIFIKNLRNPERSKISIIENYIDQLDNIKKITQEIPMQLENYYILFDNYTEKFAILISLLERYADKKLMIFFATCNSVDYYSTVLGSSFSSMSTYKLHSKISKNRRRKDYCNFLKANKAILLTTDLSSRGIDVPDIDLIIQFDPPKNEEVFIHRVGRTARVGKKGESITFINSMEKQFINYLSLKKVKIDPMETPEYKAEESLKILHNANTADKLIYDRAVKAFVSFVKFYSEHDLKYIFDIKGLDIGNLATSFQLLRLPRIKEILGRNVKNFKQSDLDPSEIKYLDSNVGTQMAKKKEKSKMKQEERKIRKEIGEIDRQVKYSRSKSERKRIKNKNNMEEWKDLAEEEKLYKKFKKGKISKEEYNSLFTK